MTQDYNSMGAITHNLVVPADFSGRAEAGLIYPGIFLHSYLRYTNYMVKKERIQAC